MCRRSRTRPIVGRSCGAVKEEREESRAIFSRFAALPEYSLSPILVRPVREQLEHDRVIRLLQAKYKRKSEVGLTPGNEQAVPVTVGQTPWFPDLVLQSTDRGRKLLGVVEVETAESVNKVEAMSQWATFGRLRGAFHLYVPASMIDVARQLCVELQIPVDEVWAFSALGDQMRFTLVQRSARSSEDKRPASRPAPRPASRPARAAAARPARRSLAAATRKAAKSPRAVARKKTTRASRAQKRK